MDENQKLRRELYNETHDVAKAREAYSFIMGEGIPSIGALNAGAQQLRDGIYIVYQDGSYALFDGTNTTSGAARIGVVMGEKRLCVSFRDIDDICLTNKEDKTEYDGYISDWNSAVADWNGQKNTEHIKAVGTDIELEEGEWIPALGEAYLLFINKKRINEALKYLGQPELEDEWYWVSTENSARNAWTLYFINGIFNYYSKSDYSFRVRPVSAWPC